MRTYTVQLQGEDIRVTEKHLAWLRNAYVGRSELAGRISELMWVHMHVLDAVFGINPREVLSAIKELEDGVTAGVKGAAQFKHSPLRGLHYKHYFAGRFIAHNVLASWGRAGAAKIVDEVMALGLPQERMIEELAHRATTEALEARAAKGRLTGEWIIYVQNGGKNYYLACGLHEGDHQALYDEILKNCVRDFPDLPAWLKALQS